MESQIDNLFRSNGQNKHELRKLKHVTVISEEVVHLTAVCDKATLEDLINKPLSVAVEWWDGNENGSTKSYHMSAFVGAPLRNKLAGQVEISFENAWSSVAAGDQMLHMSGKTFEQSLDNCKVTGPIIKNLH